MVWGTPELIARGSHCGCCGRWMEGEISDSGWSLCDECIKAGEDFKEEEPTRDPILEQEGWHELEEKGN
ncbi:hypothetical protein LCGC14_0729640 [marine sediment metagenome]|uniref:Uncharacterized protein n=1 Tax=marine sediment metagenome TaxID=412755 RepID=A0A0F9QV28_9ZZZZ